MRSLEEREGDTPDAVLSRAEARLRDGQVARALEELQALSDPGRQAMSDWIERAQTRVAAQAALDDLAAALNAN